MKYLVLCLFFFIVPLEAFASGKGSTVNLGIACIEPTIVHQITKSAETSIEDASERITQAQLAGVCILGRFNATLQEKISSGVDADGSTYETWEISKNGVTAYTFILIPPSI